MQYKYIECELPSNGLIYPTKVVHLRPKTIFDIKSLLLNPVFYLKSEIDALQNCIDPKDNINVYDLVNQDVVFLLYKLRSLSNDDMVLIYKNKEYNIKLSELEVKFLDSWDNERTLPDSGMKVFLAYTPIKNNFFAQEQQQEFLSKFPDYQGDVANTLAILNSISMIDNVTDKNLIRNKMENLSWKDSVYLITEIENFNHNNFGINEEVEIEFNGEKVKVPLKITEEFFRSAL